MVGLAGLDFAAAKGSIYLPAASLPGFPRSAEVMHEPRWRETPSTLALWESKEAHSEHCEAAMMGRIHHATHPSGDIEVVPAPGGSIRSRG